MKIVLFYEKPGCATNTKQKKMLRQAGCMVLERNLLENGLSKEELLAFLKPLHVSDWFNPNAPMIKTGEVDPYAISEAAALEILMRQPILIRRPLMVIGNRKLCGFDAKVLETILEVPLGESVGEACSSDTLTCN